MTAQPPAGDGPSDAFARTSEAARSIAGVIAARARGDDTGAGALLADLDEAGRAAGGLFLAQVALALLAQELGRDLDDVAGELSLHIADSASRLLE